MIGKIKIGGSFRGCINYCLRDKIQGPGKELVMKGRAEILSYNLCGGNGRELAAQFHEVSGLNMKVSKPVMHISLSFAPGDVLDKGKMIEMVEACAVRLGFDKNQYISIYHKDTDHQHLHIIANRIGFDGKTVSDSNNYQKMAKYCREIELRYDLKKVLSPKIFLSQKDRLLERHDQRKEQLKSHIKLSIQRSKNISEFESAMKKLGYEIIKGRGIAFRDKQKVYTKGSEVGYSLMNIEKQLEQAQSQKLYMKPEHHRSARHQEHEKSLPQKMPDQTRGHSRNHAREKSIFDILIDPVHEYDQTPAELLEEQRKQKRQHKISR